jgi:hypothetical protein
MSKVAEIFKVCASSIRDGVLIQREGKDKEFHFQNWFLHRLEGMNLHFDTPGRNSYPDFRLVEHLEGFELKALAYPGREADYDCNSQVPCGNHNGREVYYVFGRYPAKPDGSSYPVLDLVLCHGSFLNADNTYVHKNKSFRGFGSYGDILVRDRKMYVAPTPFALVEGTAHRRTLIVPESVPITDADFVEIGTLKRREVDNVVVTYSFDLRTNEMKTTEMPNKNAGKVHVFKAYRLKADPEHTVRMRDTRDIIAELEQDEACDDED